MRPLRHPNLTRGCFSEGELCETGVLARLFAGTGLIFLVISVTIVERFPLGLISVKKQAIGEDARFTFARASESPSGQLGDCQTVFPM